MNESERSFYTAYEWQCEPSALLSFFFFCDSKWRAISSSSEMPSFFNGDLAIRDHIPYQNFYNTFRRLHWFHKNVGKWFGTEISALRNFFTGLMDFNSNHTCFIAAHSAWRTLVSTKISIKKKTIRSGFSDINSTTGQHKKHRNKNCGKMNVFAIVAFSTTSTNLRFISSSRFTADGLMATTSLIQTVCSQYCRAAVLPWSSLAHFVMQYRYAAIANWPTTLAGEKKLHNNAQHNT